MTTVSAVCRRWLAPISLLTCVFGLVTTVQAEGTAQLGTTQALRAGTGLYVDIISSSTESIRWTGAGSVTVYGPNSAALGSMQSGGTKAASAGNGAYKVVVNSDQSIGSTWDVTVVGATNPAGRLFSKNWQFNAGSYAQSAATSASFYALVPGGNGTSNSVIELKLAGLAGYIYDINANRTGVAGVNAGRSVPEAGNSTVPEYKIYLQVPALADFASATPGVFGLNYVGGVDTDVFGHEITPCTEIRPGESQGYFYFTSVTSGSYHLQCDLDGDGEFDLGSGNDLLLIGNAAAGSNVVPWNGVHAGSPIEPGDYDCRIRVTVGEFHYVGRDIETSYPGMRMFRVNANGTRTGLPMFWNDSLVQSTDAKMPNKQFGLESSEGTIVPGSYESAAVANVNARSWGNFTGNGKGNVSFLDTYVWLSEATSSLIQVTAVDDSDSDSDGLNDFEERCLLGSDPDDSDTDNDGTPDGAQYAVPASSAFSGLESNGRLSSALARRSIRQTRMSVDNNAIGVSSSALELEGSLSAWLPSSLGASSAVANTPTDLVQVTNALEVSGVDYRDDNGTQIAGALLVATAGELYEHQKAVCDRVKGARLIDVRPIDIGGFPLFQSTVTQASDGRLEYSVTIYLVEDAANDSWTPYSLWVKEQAPDVEEGARVVALQSWARTPELARELASSILDNVANEQEIAWPKPAPIVDDEDYVSPETPVEPHVDLASPSVVVQQASALGDTINLRVRRQAGGGDITLRVVALADDGKTTNVTLHDVELGTSAIDVPLELAPFLDATVDVIDAENVVDRVWITDGAWAPFDEKVWTGDTRTDAFSRSDCEPRDLAKSHVDAAWRAGSTSTLQFSGCAFTSAAGGPSRGGLARYFTEPQALGDFGSVAYYAKIEGTYSVCIDGAGKHACVAMPAVKDGKFEAVPLSAFDGVTQAELVTFVADDSSMTEMEVSALSLLEANADTRAKVPTGLTCSVQHTANAMSSAWIVGLAGLALLMRRRKPSK